MRNNNVGQESLFDIHEELIEYRQKESTDWKWEMSSGYPQKRGLTAFSMFACGGGSTMGYKRMGIDVIGCNEIDPKMNNIYIKNHNPKHNFLMDIRAFNKLANSDMPQELFDLDILDGSPPCFEKGTKVRTLTGYKNIEDIVIGDEVLTHLGNYKKVYDIMNKSVNDYLSIKIKGCLPFKVTQNHPFYTMRMNRRNKKGVRKFSIPEWKNASDLSVVRNNSNSILEQDYIAFPIDTKQEFPKWNGVEHEHKIYGKTTIKKIKNNLDFSSNYFWDFVGRYIGDGWLRHSRHEVILCGNKLEREEISGLLDNANLKYTLCEMETTIRYTISNIELYTYLLQFGSGTEGKHLTSDIFNLPIEQLKSFLDGYLDADGYYYKDNDTYSLSSVSKELILGAQRIIAKCYKKATSIVVRDNTSCILGRDVIVKPLYTIRFKKEKSNSTQSFYEDNILWVAFNGFEKNVGALDVYNFSVEEDESYTVYNLAVHNCTTFSMAGKREKSWGVEKKFREGQAKQTLDDLSFIFIETVDKLKPRVVIMENVEGIIKGNAFAYVKKIYSQFASIGYKVKHWLVKGEYMGIPQARHRVFFVATRLDFDLDTIDMSFNYKPVLFKEVKEGIGKGVSALTKALLDNATTKDKCLADVNIRLYQKTSRFNEQIVWDDVVAATIHNPGTYRGVEKTHFSLEDFRNCATFPGDYDFGDSVATCAYVCGMSVPPLMTKRVVERLYESGLFDYKLKT